MYLSVLDSLSGSYNVVIRVTTPVSGGVTTLVQPNNFTYMMQNSARMAAAELSLL